MFMFITKVMPACLDYVFLTGIAQNTFELIDNASLVSVRKENAIDSCNFNFQSEEASRYRRIKLLTLTVGY